MSCILTSVLCDDLDPVFGSLIVEDLALMKSQIIFVGLGCGQVYSIPVMIEGKILPTPKILYNSTQSIKAIVCLKGLYFIYAQYLKESIRAWVS